MFPLSPCDCNIEEKRQKIIFKKGAKKKKQTKKIDSII